MIVGGGLNPVLIVGALGVSTLALVGKFDTLQVAGEWNKVALLAGG